MNFANAKTLNYGADISTINNRKTAIYCRLSKDDDKQGESESIKSQRDMLERFCDEKGFEVVAIYQDDGYSGLSTNRPDFKRMLKSIERGQIDIVVTKDLSRLGRNHLDTGELIEKFFPKNNVRYIALNDNVDTKEDVNDIIPFKNILNEMYSKDVSKKVHSSYVSKARKGEFTGCLAPLGYKKDEHNKNKLVVDETTSHIVKIIFQYALEGYATGAIRRRLYDRKIETPTWHNRQKGLRNKYTKFEKEDPVNGRYIWDDTTIAGILTNPVYIGSIASQKSNYKFKVGWLGDKPQDEWIVAEDMHEAIIDKDEFNIVQEKIKSRKKQNTWGNYSIFAGLIKCGNCGSALCVKYTNCKQQHKIFSCLKYTKYGKKHCTQHSIKYNFLYDLVLEQIKNYAKMALADDENIISFIDKNFNDKSDKEKDLIEKNITEYETKITELTSMISRIYSDNISGVLDDDNFNILMDKTVKEQTEIKERLKLAKERLETSIKTKSQNKKWKNIIKSYADINELDRETLNLLVKKIFVYEDFIDGKSTQTVEIHFNFVDVKDKLTL